MPSCLKSQLAWVHVLVLFQVGIGIIVLLFQLRCIKPLSISSNFPQPNSLHFSTILLLFLPFFIPSRRYR
ncbi:hypothetical protein F5H01DRAFT_346586 [Linnemannia elongata]|nr:hypothetical protein F5H01DRAFT_346586 [Linnemannia elongata]